MKKITIIAVIIFAAFTTNAQVLYNNGATLTLKTGGTMQVNGNAQFQSGGTITNDGTITITGNITNNQTMSAANAGKLTLNGTAAQTLSGSSTYFAKDVIVNNAIGVTLNTALKVDGVFNFNNGIITAATTANAVTFTINATVSSTNTAKDASHVNGYVVKEGTSSFIYPVGDGTKYQKVTINPGANATGISVKYNTTDAGTGTFTTGGLEPTTLVSYNKLEYWDIAPLSTATGTVTIFWDEQKIVGITNVAHLKVAHLTGGNWLNEGGTGIGTNAAGSVTSNSISTWSPFTLGSINAASTLPIQFLSATGNLNTQKQATITWEVQETNVAKYSIEKSTDGSTFNAIGITRSKGDGKNDYSFVEVTVLNSVGYYRIKQIDFDGRFSYSSIIKLTNGQNSTLAIYPNPVKDVVTISGAIVGSKATLTDISGKQMLQINITNAAFTIDMSKYASGVYLLRLQSGEIVKIIKQ